MQPKRLYGRGLSISFVFLALCLLQLAFVPLLTTVYAQSPARCLLYMVQDDGENNSRFVTFDPLTGDIANFGPLLDGWNVEALDIHPVTGIIYFATSDNPLGTSGELYTLDGVTGVVNRIGSTGTVGIDSLAFNPNPPYTLWAASEDGDTIYTVDITNANVTVQKTSIPGGEGIAWNQDGTILYMSTISRVWKYNPASNSVTTHHSNALPPTHNEGFESIPNGHLLGGTSHASGVNLYIYDPDASDQNYPNAIVDELLVGSSYDDLEGLGWPTDPTCAEFTFSPICTIDVAVDATLDPFTNNILVFVNAEPETAVDYLEFTTSDPSHAYFDPANPVVYNPPSSFAARLITLSPGSVDIIVTARDVNGVACTPEPASVTVNIANQSPWWQIYGGSVWANTGDVLSKTPSGGDYTAYLLNNLSQSGVPIITDGTIAASGSVPSTVSAGNNWRVENNSNYSTSTFDFDFFYKRLGSPVVTSGAIADNNIGTQSELTNCNVFSNQYKYCYYNGNFIVGDGADINIGNERIILLVNGNLEIRNRVNLTKGSGFFMAIADGDIVVSDSVSGNPPGFPPTDTSSLEGVFLAMNDFVIEGSGADDQIRIRGTVVALNRDGDFDKGVVLERSLSNNAVGPATVFEFAPDLIMRYPSFLGTRLIQWSEIAP